MVQAFITMCILTAIAAGFAYKKDPSILIDAGKSGTLMSLKIIPIILVALFLANLVGHILPKENIARYVGKESGWNGLLIGAFLGIVTPGGPFVQFPIVVSLLKAGADIGPVVAYLSAWSLLGLNRVLAVELPILGVKVTGVRFVSSLLFPPIIGFIARLLWKT